MAPQRPPLDQDVLHPSKKNSNIKLLKGTYNAVGLVGTRTALEEAVHSKIGCKVKLDLKLRRLKCKSTTGRKVTTNIFGVSFDSRQVSKAVKGLRAVLNNNYLPSKGRKISFVTKNNKDLRIQRKKENLLEKNHEDVVNERKLYRKIGVPVTATVIMTSSKVCMLQQALCAISTTNGGSLFT